ncbi:hypothetical protein ACFE04_021950 [Oxalis oulophora]
MASLSGFLQRPLVAAAAVVAASASPDLSNRFQLFKSSDTINQQLEPSVADSINEKEISSWVSSNISNSRLANLSFVNRIRLPVPNVRFPVPYSSFVTSNGFYSPPNTSTLPSLYSSAKLENAFKPNQIAGIVPDSSQDLVYQWHLPQPNAFDVSECSSAKSRTVVVLLGWLGAKQKHLKKYAEWYTSMGFHVITFTFPMSEVLSYQIGGKAEDDVGLLANHLAGWLDEEQGKNLVFHTFSNTGWLTYGAILELFQKQDPSLMGQIKGCIVDSAPVAAPDPQVWASGFSAAFLKKHSVATKGSNVNVIVGDKCDEPKPALTETALLLILEKIFAVVLNLPAVNRRLSNVITQLSSGQPNCPQLYIYSSADRVIPAESVESFIEKQRRAGLEVRACNFVSTPHVDHFRNDPQRYTTQLSQFLEDCVLTCCKRSS